MESGSNSPDDESLDELQDTYTRIEEEVSAMDGLLEDLEERATEHDEAAEPRRAQSSRSDTGNEEPPILLQLTGTETDSETMEKLERAHRSMRREHLALRDLVTQDFMGYLRDVAGAVRRIGSTVKDLNQRVQDSQEAMAARRDTIDELRGTVKEQRTRLNQVEEQVKHLQARLDLIANQLD